MTATALVGLFISAFLSATLLPGSSEAVLIAVLGTVETHMFFAIGIATIANTLGSCVNWWLGKFALRFQGRDWFPVNAVQFESYGGFYQKWGVWSLFASWVPIIGDPLTVIAGFARTPLLKFVIIVFIAKWFRYMFVAGVFVFLF